MGKAEFETFVDGAGEERWRLRAANGEIVAQSEGYGSPEARDRGIDAAKRAALEAMGIDRRKRLTIGTHEIVEKVDGEHDGELETTGTGPDHFVALVDAAAAEKLPL